MFSQQLHMRPSQIHGNGIFTSRRIYKGERIYTIPLCEVYTRNINVPGAYSLDGIPVADTKKIQWINHHCAYVGNNRYVSDPIVLNHVNHSCNPTSTLVSDHSPFLLAQHDINIGEEITCNYNDTESMQFRTHCLCSQKNCQENFISNNRV